MRTPGLWASMRGIYALRSFGEAEGDSSRIRGLPHGALRAPRAPCGPKRLAHSPARSHPRSRKSSFRGHDLSHTGRFAPRARNGECATRIPGGALRATRWPAVPHRAATLTLVTTCRDASATSLGLRLHQVAL